MYLEVVPPQRALKCNFTRYNQLTNERALLLLSTNEILAGDLSRDSVINHTFERSWLVYDTLGMCVYTFSHRHDFPECLNVFQVIFYYRSITVCIYS